MKLLLVCSLFILLICGGCKEAEKVATEQVKTVSYYKENLNERLNKLKECANNPGELENTPNCINAAEANINKIKGDPSKYRL